MKYKIALLSLLFQYEVQAQMESFGTLRAEEISVTNCAFDKDADAVILLHEARTTYDEWYHLITDHHIKIKILTKKGIDEANIAIPYQSHDEFESVSNIKAHTINTDANGQQTWEDVERKSFYKQGKTLYWSEIKFTFPSVKVGSILEYSYTSLCQNYGGLNEWDFQSELPVLKSRYDVAVLPDCEFKYVIHKRSELPVDLKKTDHTSIQFTMENIPGLRSEPYMNARRDYLQHVEFQLSGYKGGPEKEKFKTSWDEAIRELNDYNSFTTELNKHFDGTEDLLALAKGLPPLKRMDTIYNFVRNTMTWNGVWSKYTVDGVKSAWNKKSATSGEINLILIGLLKDAGLEAYPMLVSERSHGKVQPNMVFLGQFNSTYAAVIIDGKKYYLDATDKFTPSKATPFDILNTTALILNRKAGGLINISDESLTYQDRINVTAAIAEDGTISGNAFISGKDYARSVRLRQYKADREKYIKEFGGGASGISIEGFKTANENIDSMPLQHTFQFKGHVNRSGDYIFIPLYLFSGYETNPFLADTRLTDINFGCRQNISINFTSSIPEGYGIDALPKSIQLMNPDKTILFTRQLFRDENSNNVVARIRVELSKTFYTADEYPALKEFYKNMFDLLNEPIVLRKK